MTGRPWTQHEITEHLLAELGSRPAIDERERRSIERTQTELGRLVAPFDVDADPVHVTGSALIVGPRGIVLLEHRRLGIWVQPGGHVDPGETPWAAARREAIEETGLDVTWFDDADPPRLAHVDVHDGGRGHTHLDLRYLLHGGAADPAPPPEESQHVEWFDWSAALERAEPAMAPLLTHLAATLVRD